MSLGAVVPGLQLQVSQPDAFYNNSLIWVHIIQPDHTPFNLVTTHPQRLADAAICWWYFQAAEDETNLLAEIQGGKVDVMTTTNLRSWYSTS